MQMQLKTLRSTEVADNFVPLFTMWSNIFLKIPMPIKFYIKVFSFKVKVYLH